MKGTKLLSGNPKKGTRRREELERIVVRDVRIASYGMTLIELLIVVAIIVALAGLTYSALMQARKQAYLATCINNLRQLVLAVHAYENDWGMVPIESVEETPEGLYGFYPQLLQPYIRDESILLCPAEIGKPTVSFTWRGREWRASYDYFINHSTISLYKITRPFPDMVLFYCPNHRGKHVIARYDGRIEIVPVERYISVGIITKP